MSQINPGMSMRTIIPGVYKLSRKYRSLESIIKEVVGKSIVPNQGDATTVADLSARGCAQESGGKVKKKIKEDTSSNVDLIRKGSLLNKNPLTKYTNPIDVLPPSEPGDKTPSLKLKGGDAKEIPFELPKLPKSSANTDTQMDKSVTRTVPAPASKLTTDTLTKTDTLKSNVPATMPVTTTGKVGAGAGVMAPSATMAPELALGARLGPPGVAAAAATILAKKAWDNSPNLQDRLAQGAGIIKDKIVGSKPNMDLAPSNMVSTPKAGSLDKYTNPAAGIETSSPAQAVQPHNFINQKQATPPSSPAIAPNQVSAAPTNVIGSDGQAGNLNHHSKAAQTVIDRAQDAIDRATSSAVGVSSPAMTQTPSSSRVGGASQKQQPVMNKATSSAVGVKPAVDTQHPVTKMNQATPSAVGVKPSVDNQHPVIAMNRATSSAVGVPSPAMTQKPADARVGDSQKTQDVLNQPLPSAVGVKPKVDIQHPVAKVNQATPSAVGVPSTAMSQTPAASRVGDNQKQQDVINQELPSAVGVKPKVDAQHPVVPLNKDIPSAVGVKPNIDTARAPADTAADTKGQSTWDRIKQKLNNNKNDKNDNKNNNSGKWLSALGLGGLAGVGGYAALKWLMKNMSGHDFNKKQNGSSASSEIFSPQGRLNGLPTKRTAERLGGSMGESTESDKIRRSVEYVARRGGDRKTKDKTGRQSAIRTRIIDEGGLDWVEVAREAVKEKMRRDKARKLAKLAASQTTAVDTDPKLQPPPQDAR